MNELTVIIPFLNEGEEIGHTLQSIRETAGETVDILLVNDCSTDGVDYEKVARKYRAEYLVNDERRGVARSREIGVKHTLTPYFILLDGHMRFFDRRWHVRAIECLKEDDRAVYCFRCGVLSEDRRSTVKTRNGARISLYGESYGSLLDPVWREETPDRGVKDIPCVLGASYSMSKRYWNYLRGLAMLRHYGSDEAYLSLKVWLEGGRCRLICDVEAGHVFRTVAQRPYDAYFADGIYNKLLIAETLLPELYTRYLRASFKALSPDHYYTAAALVNSRRTEMEELKAYYRSIFTRDFASFETFNALHAPSPGTDFTERINSDTRSAARQKTDEIAACLMERPLRTAGLFAGELGEIVFLYRYARLRGDTKMKAAIDQRLFRLLDTADMMHHYNVMSGAAGTGLGLLLLKEEGFIDIDIAGVLSQDTEDRLREYMRRDAERSEFGLLRGASGLGYYFLRRGGARYLPAVEALVARLDNYAASLTGEVPLNISDGLSGMLLFLSEAYRNGITAAERGMKQMVDYILRQEQDGRGHGSLFPPAGGTAGGSALAADSGDLAVGCALLRSGTVCGRADWRDKGVEILRSTAARLDPVVERVAGAGLAGGASGIAMVYRMLHRATGVDVFGKAAGYWTRQILYRSVEGVAPAGYKAYGSTAAEDQFGLWSGIAGIGLALVMLDDVGGSV